MVLKLKLFIFSCFVIGLFACKKDNENAYPVAPRPIGNIPEIITFEITDITQNSAIAGGEVTSSGGLIVTSRGVCWSTGTKPTTYDFKVTGGAGIGAFTCQINGLNPNTTFFVRAYAINKNGTAYGDTVSFTTLP